VPIVVWIAIGAIVGLLLWLFAGRGLSTPPAEDATPPADTPAPAAERPAPSSDTGSDAPPPAPTSATATPAPPPAAAPPPAPPAATDPPAAERSSDASTSAGGIAVGEAQLCTTLSSNYRCTPAGATVRPGSLVFFTRVIASSSTSVVHRWYRGDEVRQSVRLEVPARRQGYRTFSRTTVTASDGEWRVELRTRDGQLLHTERFTVR
jgi:hypothetical protein